MTVSQWNDILGQDDLAHLLVDIASSEVCNASILLIGPEGSGKRTFARLFAKAVLCLDKSSGTPCGQCKSCRQFDRGNHPDFHNLEIGEDEVQIKVEPMRQLESRAYRAPVESPNRVLFIPGAERMNPSAANAFLKTLEEPPEGTVIILTASSDVDILPTILSRCLRLPMRRIPDDMLAEVLSKKYGLKPTDARQRAALAQGRLGRALDTRPRDRVIGEFISGDLNRVLQQPDVSRITQVILEATARAIEEEQLKDSGHVQRNMIGDVFSVLGICLRYALHRAAGASDVPELPDGWDETIARLAKNGVDRIELASQALTRATEGLEHFVRPSLCVRHVARRLASCAR